MPPSPRKARNTSSTSAGWSVINASKRKRIGYVRVSSFDQNPERQLEQIQVDKVFTDKASGKDTRRPELERLLAFVREGDTVVVHSMDRLARNLDDLRRLVQGLTQRGVRIEFLKEHLTFTGEDSPMANLMLSVMGAFAEFERALIRERQREGIRPLRGQGRAHITGGVADGPGQTLRGQGLRGQDHVALVLAVLVVEHQHRAAGPQGLQGSGELRGEVRRVCDRVSQVGGRGGLASRAGVGRRARGLTRHRVPPTSFSTYLASTSTSTLTGLPTAAVPSV